MASAKRELFKSPDVCQITGLQPYVLRSWEAEFPRLGQSAPGGAGKVYRREDVELVLRIKQLVFVEGLTLAGARRRLEEESAGPSPAAIAVSDVLGDFARTKLRLVRSGLEDILQLLNRNGAAPELQLVAPTSAARKPREKSTKRVVMAARPARPAPPAVRSTGGKKRRVS